MWAAAAGLVTAAAMAAAGPGTGADQLQITLYRSWYPPNVTVVNGLFRVDGAMLGTGDACEYHVRLSVDDSAGTRLVNNEWDGHCPAAVDGKPSAALETFQFAVVPSHYTVQVTVDAKNVAQPMRLSARVPLESLALSARTSDLILATKVGWVDSTSNVQWTIKKNKLGIAAASEAVAGETNPYISYYLEIYPREMGPMNGTLVGVIRRPDGKQIARLDLQKVQQVTEARPLAGNLSLAGLAPGDYVLEARLELSDTVLVRTHAFRMEGRDFAEQAPGAPTTGYFASLSDEQLSQLFDPVSALLQKQSDRDLYGRLNPDGRRRFLAQYFGVTQPSAGGQANNALDMYLARVQFVNREYAGRGGQAGWTTDRGHIYLLRGAPQSKVAKPLPPGGSSPYEIWQYTSAPGYFYLFIDESRINSYRLIVSSDPNESTLPDWDRRLSDEAVEDIRRMGIRLPNVSGGGLLQN